MAGRPYVEFKPSHRKQPAASTRIGDVEPGEQIQISLYLKPHPEGGMASPLTREQFAATRAAQHKAGISRIEAFAHETGLKIVSVEPARRLVKLSGTAEQLQAAFHVTLVHYHDGKRRFRGRSGCLFLPQDMEQFVEAILGLDTRPAATPKIIIKPHASATPNYLPNQIGKFYDFPTGVTGAGQCIALVELGGGYKPADIDTAFKAMGLKPPHVVTVPVDGGANRPTPDDGADGEVALDIQVAGGVAPDAVIAVYFASNTDAGFVDAVTAAVHDTTNKPSVISISWGSAESNWTSQSLATMTSALQDAAALNISVFVAAGDNLATDSVTDGKAHVDFPASSPWAIGCGGTRIAVAREAITTETVWNNGDSGTGGGISDVYPVPDFQKDANLPVSVNDGHAGRGVPDVAADADPNSGYTVYVNGQQEVVGGTSAVAPLWAGLAALINQKAAAPIGFFLPAVYGKPNLTRQITSGNNEPAGSKVGYVAGTGWNACTGLGVPNGQALFDGLIAASGIS